MSALQPPDLTDLEALAGALGITRSALRQFVFHADCYYAVFHLRKRSGGRRAISAPSTRLKGIQRWIAREILDQTVHSPCCTGFVRGRSIVHNARQHRGHRTLLNIDLADFFPSVTINRVFGLFRGMGYNNAVASALARLTTHGGVLPQGAPTSPAIANAVCGHLDLRLSAYCKRRHWTYTRYCDDISVSGKGNISGASIATITSIVESEGFRVNGRKLHVQRRPSRQVVTGLVVNDGVAIPRKRRRELRALFHQACQAPYDFLNRIDELHGHVAFLRMVNEADPALDGYADTVALVRRTAAAVSPVGFRACLFVEGHDDVVFWRTVSERLREAGHLPLDLEQAGICVMLLGGQNVEHWLHDKVMPRLSSAFAVIIDRDLRANQQQLRNKCRMSGGIFRVLRKREIENYLHPDVLPSGGLAVGAIGDDTDMKAVFGEKVIRRIGKMTAEQILEMDRYTDRGNEKHELLEIAIDVLDLAEVRTE